MGPWGAVILSFFGTVFYSAALAEGTGIPMPYFLFGALVFATIATAACLQMRLTPARENSQKVRRVIMWSSIGEGVGILIAINVLINIGRPHLQLPAIAAIVGLHFLPIAYVVRRWTFYFTAIALILGAVAGVIIRAPVGPEIAGMTAAATLWSAAGLALLRSHLLSL